MLPIVGIYAAILGLLACALTINVVRHRVTHKVESGDGGFSALKQAHRAHGNFIEQAPIMLILLASAEGAGARGWILHVIGILLLVARFSSAWALTHSLGMSTGRQVSGGLSILLLFVTPLVLLLALLGVR